MHVIQFQWNSQYIGNIGEILFRIHTNQHLFIKLNIVFRDNRRKWNKKTMRGYGLHDYSARYSKITPQNSLRGTIWFVSVESHLWSVFVVDAQLTIMLKYFDNDY